MLHIQRCVDVDCTGLYSSFVLALYRYSKAQVLTESEENDACIKSLRCEVLIETELNYMII